MGVSEPYDVFIVGGGINGCGIARDAAGRGFSVCLAEMNDLASGTSSWSTKLIHGGLRYLEHYEFRLVREALLDFDFREVKVAQAIIENARHVMLVSDSTKFERTAPVRIGHLSQVHTFVTDHCPLPAIRRICAEHSVHLIETSDAMHPAFE